MSHFRYSPLRDSWTLVSKQRLRKPTEFEAQNFELADEHSPFVFGNEHKTPSEIYAIRVPGSQPNAPGWKTRVIPNRYNALEIERSPKPMRDGIFESFDGFGAHEIVIDTPRFPAAIRDLGTDEMALLLKTVKARCADLSRDSRIAYIQPFKNQGPLAGATMAHSHTQLIALPFLPKSVSTEISQCRTHFQKTGRALFVDMVEEEIRHGKRVVEESDNYVAFCPFASRYPFEITIAPRKKTPDFTLMSDDGLEELSEIVLDALKKLSSSLKNLSLNIVWVLEPPKRDARVSDYYYRMDEFFQWRIEIVPRISVPNGFELAADTPINPVPPEEAAKFLREVEP